MGGIDDVVSWGGGTTLSSEFIDVSGVFAFMESTASEGLGICEALLFLRFFVFIVFIEEVKNYSVGTLDSMLNE